jgi:hypothetical protein
MVLAKSSCIQDIWPWVLMRRMLRTKCCRSPCGRQIHFFAANKTALCRCYSRTSAIQHGSKELQNLGPPADVAVDSIISDEPTTSDGEAWRQRLLRVVRGLSSEKRRVWKCFPLYSRHFGSWKRSYEASGPLQPHEFHATLCQLIKNAQKRVYLVTLYIGPAARISDADDAHRPLEEFELLESLRYAAERSSAGESRPLEIKIIMDRNRGLRPVPDWIVDTVDGLGRAMPTTTSAAQACHQVLFDGSHELEQKQNHGVYLVSILPSLLQRQELLPYNSILKEVMGVQHMKFYVIDDAVLLSGANLSQEYFVNRIDRYLYINDGNGLVSCYASLVRALCEYAHDNNASGDTDLTVQRYSPRSADSSCDSPDIKAWSFPRITPALSALLSRLGHRRDNKRALNRQRLLHAIRDIFTEERDVADRQQQGLELNWNAPTEVTPVGYAVPTIQLPVYCPWVSAPEERSWWAHEMPCDSETLEEILHWARNGGVNQTSGALCVARIASAYLNPTESVRRLLYDRRPHPLFVHWLTAGTMSHGMKPKKLKHPAPTVAAKEGDAPPPQAVAVTGGNRSDTAWIPQVFDHLYPRGDSSTLWFYERNGWTFHSKGMWLSILQHSKTKRQSNLQADNPSTATGPQFRFESSAESLAMVSFGSGNYGIRSSDRDLESNLFLVLPSKSPLHVSFIEEWNSYEGHVQGAPQQPINPLPWHLRVCVPILRHFF